MKIDPSIYTQVFNAVIDEDDLEDIFRRFNTEGHPLYRGTSMSVSDIVVTEDGKAHFCDSIGFKDIDFDVFAKGPDQTHAGFQRAVQWCEENGKTVVVIPRTEGISSTMLREYSRTK